MNLAKTEDHHHTPAQVAGYLDEARRLLTEAGLNELDLDATLAVLVTLLSSKQVFYEQAAPLVPRMAIPGNARH